MSEARLDGPHINYYSALWIRVSDAHLNGTYKIAYIYIYVDGNYFDLCIRLGIWITCFYQTQLDERLLFNFLVRSNLYYDCKISLYNFLVGSQLYYEVITHDLKSSVSLSLSLGWVQLGLYL